MSESVSAREADYLKAIYRLEVGGPVSPGDLVTRLGVSGAAVSRMTGRLAAAGLVRRTAYHGVTLTDQGRRHALRVLRHHRLTEVWMVKHLGYDWAEVEEDADALEHAFSDQLALRLETVLGHPTHCPHGDPIPDSDLNLPEIRERPLNTMPIEQACIVSRVVGGALMLRHLHESGLIPGAALMLIARAPVGGLLTVAIDGVERPVSLEVAAAVFVRRPSEG